MVRTMSSSIEYQNEIELRLLELRKKLNFGERAAEIVERDREILDELAQT